MATLDDIAKALGISKSTVSKALNGAKDVSKAMRQTVLEKAVEMGYSRAARSAEMPRLAVFVINMEYTKPEDFGYELVMGFRQAAEPSGYQVELIPLTQQLQLDIHYDTYMIQNNYSGALLCDKTGSAMVLAGVDFAAVMAAASLTWVLAWMAGARA